MRDRGGRLERRAGRGGGGARAGPGGKQGEERSVPRAGRTQVGVTLNLGIEIQLFVQESRLLLFIEQRLYLASTMISLHLQREQIA